MVNGIIDFGGFNKNKYVRWGRTSYPKKEMNKMEKSVRDKAIDIANSLVKTSGADENEAIQDAINRTKDLAQKRKQKNISIENLYSNEGFNFPYHL